MSDTVIDLVNDSETEDVVMIEDQPETSVPKVERESMDTNEPEVAEDQDSDDVEFVPVNIQISGCYGEYY